MSGPRTLTLESVYRSELAYVVLTLKRLGVAPAAVEDVAQEVFLQISARLGDFDSTKPLRPWVFGFAYRCATNWRGQARHRRETEPPADTEDERPGPEEQLEAWRARKLVRDVLQQLDEDKRAIFILHELDEIPVPEAAAILQLNTDTAWSRLRTARRQFNELCLALLARREEPTHG